MYTNESAILLCRTDHLSTQDFNLLEKQNDEVYQVNVIIDQPGSSCTPTWPVMGKYEDTSVARVVGSTGDAADVIRTADKARCGKLGWTVVGFEAVLCRVLHNAEPVEILKIIVLLILLRTVKSDLTQSEELELVVGDVFRAPIHPLLFCVMVGDGVQILGMAVVTIVFGGASLLGCGKRSKVEITLAGLQSPGVLSLVFSLFQLLLLVVSLVPRYLTSSILFGQIKSLVRSTTKSPTLVAANWRRDFILGAEVSLVLTDMRLCG
ncbi:hypothetical protein OPV22_032117 [Ensete ventricosum]|uniref:Transmembrane 9 superfamily member n=1 Tax=Ensete ventricosum TaxID=4639 RepID=A0AAV8NZU7_ENSVE|nr:hypothetical protein OPV22_032117 [Ensete ventricosum]